MIPEMQSLFDNEKALESPIYNPDIDQEVIKLYQTMDEPDEAVIADFSELYLSMPTENPFKGFLVNPNACDISENITDIQEVKALLNELHDEVIKTGTAPEVYDWQIAMPGFTADLDESLLTMDEMMDHTDRLIANLPTIIGAAQTQTGIDNALSGLGDLDGIMSGAGGILGGAGGALGALGACFPVQGFLGSIMSQGKALLGQVKTFVSSLRANIMGAINEVKNQILGHVGSAFQSITDVLDMVKSGIANVMGKVNAIKDMIKQEMTKMISSMIGMMRIGLLQMIQNLLNDPCLKGIVGAVTGGKLG